MYSTGRCNVVHHSPFRVCRRSPKSPSGRRTDETFASQVWYGNFTSAIITIEYTCLTLLRNSGVAESESLYQYVIYDAPTKPAKGPKRINLDDPPAPPGKKGYAPPKSLLIHLSKIDMPELQPRVDPNASKGKGPDVTPGHSEAEDKEGKSKKGKEKDKDKDKRERERKEKERKEKERKEKEKEKANVDPKAKKGHKRPLR